MRVRWRWLLLLLFVGFLGFGGYEMQRIARLLRPPPAAAEPAKVADAQSHRRLHDGEVVGYRSASGAHVWRLIPFAAPPVGALRWRAPRPPAAWSSVRESLEASPSCVQPENNGLSTTALQLSGQEDCLYLDVYAPAMSEREAARTRLPVMMWIYGGANIIGGAARYDGSRLAAEQHAIVVIPNYRLGVLGWFAHPGLAAGDGADPALDAEDRSGNYATLDQIAALRWVQQNIAAFGGDARDVTIFGESAGGANVLSLLISPLTSGLFQRAISQSGVIYSYSMQQARAYTEEGGDDESASEVLARLWIAGGRAKDRAGAKLLARQLDPAAQAAELRAQSPMSLFAASVFSRARGDDRPMGFPCGLRDGYVLPEQEPLALFARGAYQRVPTILGTNRDELKLFMLNNPELVSEVARGVSRVKDADFYAVLAQYRSQAWRSGTVNPIADAMRETGGAPVYSYRFDWDEEPWLVFTDLALLVGAAHGLDVAFTFGNFPRDRRSAVIFNDENKAGREALANAMMSYWTEFARSGNPGRGRRGDLPQWQDWGHDARFMRLDAPDDGGLRMDKDATSIDSLVARLASDPRLPDVREKCRILFWLTRRGRHVPQQLYDHPPGFDCKAFPADRYPWVKS